MIAALSIFFRFEKRKIGENISYNLLEKKNDFLKYSTGLALAFFLLFFPIILAWIVSQFFPFYVPGRYEAVVLPFFIILLSFLFSQIESRYLTAAMLITIAAFAWNSARSDESVVRSYRYNDKTVTKELLGELMNGDAIVYTGLSRPTFDYYLPKLTSENKKYEEYSFPAETAAHPAFQSERILLQNKPTLESEAENMSEKLRTGPSKNIWIVYSLQSPLNDIFLEKMEHKFSCQDFLDLTLSKNGPVSPFHFQKIIKCFSE